MQAYRVIDTTYSLESIVFWLSKCEVDGDTCEFEMVVIYDDYRFLLHQGKMYRVCQVELWDTERRFIKVWDKDPFAGFEGYEQIPIRKKE